MKHERITRAFLLSLIPLLLLSACGGKSAESSEPGSNSEPSSSQKSDFTHLNRFEIAKRIDDLQTNRFFEERSAESLRKKSLRKEEKHPGSIFYPLHPSESEHLRPRLFFDEAEALLNRANDGIKGIFNGSCYQDATFTGYHLEEKINEDGNYISKYGEGSYYRVKNGSFHGSTGEDEITFYSEGSSHSFAASSKEEHEYNGSTFYVLNKDGDYGSSFVCYKDDQRRSITGDYFENSRNYAVTTYEKGAHFTSYDVKTEYDEQGEITSLILEDFVVKDSGDGSMASLYYKITINDDSCRMDYEHTIRESDGYYVYSYYGAFEDVVGKKYGEIETFDDPRNIEIISKSSIEELKAFFTKCEEDLKENIDVCNAKIPAVENTKEELYAQCEKANIVFLSGRGNMNIIGSYAYDVSDEREIRDRNFSPISWLFDQKITVGSYLLFKPEASPMFEHVSSVYANGVALPQYEDYFYLEVSEAIDYKITIKSEINAGAIIRFSDENLGFVFEKEIFQTKEGDFERIPLYQGVAFLNWRVYISVTTATGYVVARGYVNDVEMEVTTLGDTEYFTFVVTSEDPCIIVFDLAEAPEGSFATYRIVGSGGGCNFIAGESKTGTDQDFRVASDRIAIGSYLAFRATPLDYYELEKVTIDGQEVELTLVSSGNTPYYFGSFLVTEGKVLEIEITTRCTFESYSTWELVSVECEDKIDVSIYVREDLDGNWIHLDNLVPTGYYLIVEVSDPAERDFTASVTYNDGETMSISSDAKGNIFYFVQASADVEEYKIKVSVTFEGK